MIEASLVKAWLEMLTALSAASFGQIRNSATNLT